MPNNSPIYRIMDDLLNFAESVRPSRGGEQKRWTLDLQLEGKKLLNKNKLEIAIHQVPPKQAGLPIVDNN